MKAAIAASPAPPATSEGLTESIATSSETRDATSLRMARIVGARPRQGNRASARRRSGRLAPAVPDEVSKSLRRTPNRRRPMSDLVAIAYKDVASARDVARNVVEAQKAHLIELDDLVVVERRENGKIKLHQPSNTGVGALSGAAWGGLIGLIFLVPLFGMAIGAATGAAAGAASDTGVDDRFMRELGARLEDGGAALILLVRTVNAEKLLPQIKIPGEILQTSLSS